MKWVFVPVAIYLSCSVLCFGSDLPVPEKLIGAKTVMVVSLNLQDLNRKNLVESISAIAGNGPDAAAEKQMADVEAMIKQSGANSISFILSASKGGDMSKSKDSSILVIDKKDEADNTKIAELLYQLMPDVKTQMAPECPKEIEGMLVWYKKGVRIPAADQDRADSFSAAFEQVSAHQSLSVVVVPDEDAVEAAKGQLKPDEKELVSAILDGDGICLFSNIGVAADPSVKLLILAADAAGAENLSKAAQSLITQFKKELPPEFGPLLDTLKMVQAGTNVQLSVAFPEITKAAKTLMAAMAPATK